MSIELTAPHVLNSFLLHCSFCTSTMALSLPLTSKSFQR
jgi:hypothetical protein